MRISIYGIPESLSIALKSAYAGASIQNQENLKLLMSLLEEEKIDKGLIVLKKNQTESMQDIWEEILRADVEIIGEQKLFLEKKSYRLLELQKRKNTRLKGERMYLSFVPKVHPYAPSELLEILQLFQHYGLHIKYLQSIPISKHSYGYRYVADVVSTSLKNNQDMLEKLGPQVEEWHLLGSYTAIDL
jgi:hypothetical protein